MQLLIEIHYWHVWHFSDRIMLKGGIIDEWWLGRDLYGSSHGLFEVLLWNLQIRIKKNYPNP